MAKLSPEWALSRFRLVPSLVEGVSSKPKRSVWRVTTERGVFALKALRMPWRRVHFVTLAQAYLRGRCDLVPALLRAEDGGLFVDDGESRYLAMEWVLGRSPDLTAANDLRQVAASLADFHRASLGFAAPRGANPRSYLGAWPEVYRQEAEALEGFRDLARRYPGPVETMFLKAFDFIAAQAEVARRLLDEAPYRPWCEEVASTGRLCHQDFSHGNLVIGPGGVRVFDLDAMAVDLPARDLRKLLNRVLIRCWGADQGHLATVLGSYVERQPLDAGCLKVLRADLTFPHSVYRAAREYFLGGRSRLPGDRRAGKLRLLLAVELSKPTVLETLRLEGDLP